MAILAALILGAVGLFAFGAGAAIWMGSIYGSNSGGTEMSSFFTFGPIGALAGILLGVGLTLQFTGGPAGWAKGLLISAASLTGLAILALSGLALTHTSPAASPPSLILNAEVELPATAPVGTWTFDAGSISSVTKNCDGDTCTFVFVIVVDETFSGTSATLSPGEGEYRFAFDGAGLHRASDWSDWHSLGASRFRYRVSQN